MKVEAKGDGLKFDPEVYQIVAEEVLRDEIERIQRSARRSWPVREIGSLYSRDKWRLEVKSVSRTEVVASIENYAEYAGAIRTNIGFVHKKLLFDPADRSSSKLAREINRRTARKGE